MQSLLKSILGKQLGLSAGGVLVAPFGTAQGDGQGLQWQDPGPGRIVIADDFVGTTMRPEWATLKGSDGGCALFAINAQQNGVARGVTGAAAGGTVALNGTQIDSALNYYANAGGLEFEVRLKLSSVANVAVFLGFTNQVAALQIPADGTGGGNGVTYQANDCVGVLYDSTMTTKDWWLVGQAAGVPIVAQDSGLAPVATTYDTWHVSVSATGVASFYKNGTQIGFGVQEGNQANGAVTPTVALTPVVCAFSRAAASVNVDLDYLVASVARV